MSNLDRIHAAVRQEVEASGPKGRSVRADRLALSLSSRYPQSGLTLGEIRDLIESTKMRQTGKNRQPELNRAG